MKTEFPTKEQVQGRGTWYVVDAEGQVLGRLASQVASLLRGKNSPMYSPHLDVGDYCIVINAEKVRMTGRKTAQKRYYRHSGYPGGLREETAAELLGKYPERIIENAVRGMLPKNRLGRKLFKKLKVYVGAEHPHEAQGPVPFELKY